MIIKTYVCLQMTMSTSDENLVAENERLQLECINKDEEIVKVRYFILYELSVFLTFFGIEICCRQMVGLVSVT